MSTTKVKKQTSKSADIYQEVTRAIIDKMKTGDLIWKKGYAGLTAANWVTKNCYSGINYLLLNFVYQHDTCPYFATFKQIAEAGGKVKKGTKGIRIIFYKTLYKENGRYVTDSRVKNMNSTEKKGLEQFHKLKYYYVYNIMDTEGVKNFDYEKWAVKQELAGIENDEILERYNNMLTGYKDSPAIETGNINAYSPAEDKIKHIRLSDWHSKNEFVCTMLHELIHSTGHTKRLARFETFKLPAFGTPDYAQEELIAELGAAMLCNHLDILPETLENSAAYLQGWIKVLENDERLIFRASAKAQQAVSYMLG